MPALNAARKRQALEALAAGRLKDLVKQYQLEVDDLRQRELLVEALADGRRVDFAALLDDLKRDELKAMCSALELDDSGKKKEVLVERLLNGEASSDGAKGKSSESAKGQEGSPPPGAPPTPARQFSGFSEMSSFIWSLADLLRGHFKHHEFGSIILPFTVLRRLDCVLEDTKPKVLEKHAKLKGGNIKNLDPILNKITGVGFHNVSKLDFDRLKADPNHVEQNVLSYIRGFSENARDVLEQFNFAEKVGRLERANLLYLLVQRFAEVELHPHAVPNHVMGSVFEELIRKFAEQSNETAGEHFTPREVIRMMVNLLFIEDDDVLRKPGIVRTVYDPAAGTGGMLSSAEEYLRELNPQARLEVFGQEYNPETYAICKSDMMVKGQNASNIVIGDSFSKDGFAGHSFDYMLSNPPYGVEWKYVEKFVKDEAERGHAGRFGAGLPRINDGSLLFLQHMISKMKPAKKGEDTGSRIAVILNGSPLFTGDAGSGESEIRRWIIENDWLEAIVALPDQLFFNTGIHTYVWIVTNKKPKARKGKVQLINGVKAFRKMRKSLGNKRNELGDEHIDELARTYGDFIVGKDSKIFDNKDFGFQKIVVECPLRLSFQASVERIELLKEQKAFQNLAKSKKKGAKGEREVEEGKELQRAIVTAPGSSMRARSTRTETSSRTSSKAC